MHLVRSPLAHFLVGGALLYGLVHGPVLRAARPPVPEPVVLTTADVAHLRDAYARETGLVATANDEAALVDAAIDEELLVREARARGLDRHDRSIDTWLAEQMRVLTDDGTTADPRVLAARARALGLDQSDLVVRRILVHKMRLLAAREDERPPSTETLRAFFAAHRDDYRAPARVSFEHVFFATARRGAHAGADAAALLAVLRSAGAAVDEGAGQGDPFVVAPRVASQSAAEVAKVFGPAFAAELARAPDAQWVGPFASPYGMHLVRVDAREPDGVPAFEAVESRVRERWLDGGRAARLARLLAALRRQTELRVESAAWQARGTS
jgi:hypothetical protein